VRSISRRRTASGISANSRSRCRTRKSRNRPRAAWIAAFPIAMARRAVRCTTRSRTGTTSSTTTTGKSDPQPAFDQQFPGVHRPRLPGALRGSLHAEPRGHAPVAIKTVEQAIADKAYETRLHPAAAAGVRPARRWQSSVPVPPAWRPPSSLAAPATTSMSMSARAGRRPAALWHSRLQDGEELHRPPRRADGAARASPSITASMSASTSRSRSCSPIMTRCSIAAAPRRRAKPAFRASISLAFMTRCLTWCSRTARRPRKHRQRRPGLRIRSSPVPSMSSSSAAAIRRRTASAPRSARVRSRSPSSTSARSRRRRKTSSPSGRTGRPRCAPRRRRPKAPFANSRWQRLSSSAKTAC
jgi:hypothetical protein